MTCVEAVQRICNKEGLLVIAYIANAVEVEEHHAIAGFQINFLFEFTPNVYIAITISFHERPGWPPADLRHDRAGCHALLPGAWHETSGGALFTEVSMVSILFSRRRMP